MRILSKAIGKVTLLWNRYVPDTYSLLDQLYIKRDKQYIRRSRNIRLIPVERYRTGGKYSYAEWAHVIGIFQTIIGNNIDGELRMLDAGCGTGIVGIAAEPFLMDGGEYLGIDVSKEDINFCKYNYDNNIYEFETIDVENKAYNPGSPQGRKKWPTPKNSRNLVTALSLWTHLVREDAVFYFREIERVLRPGGRAIITFFLLDDIYVDKKKDSGDRKRYHNQDQGQWVFEKSAYGSENWRCPSWADPPEKAIGVTKYGVQEMSDNTSLEVIDHKPGNWKDVPGVFFQDILVFENKGE